MASKLGNQSPEDAALKKQLATLLMCDPNKASITQAVAALPDDDGAAAPVEPFPAALKTALGSLFMCAPTLHAISGKVAKLNATAGKLQSESAPATLSTSKIQATILAYERNHKVSVPGPRYAPKRKASPSSTGARVVMTAHGPVSLTAEEIQTCAESNADPEAYAALKASVNARGKGGR